MKIQNDSVWLRPARRPTVWFVEKIGDPIQTSVTKVIPGPGSGQRLESAQLTARSSKSDGKSSGFEFRFRTAA